MSDVDWSPEAWPLTKWRLLNFEDTGHCVDLDANAAYLRGLAADYETALPRKKPRKVFGCGLSKTGTTSLNAALRTLRYRNSDMSAGFWAEAIDAEREEPELFVEMDRRAPASDVQNTSLVRAIHAYFDALFARGPPLSGMKLRPPSLPLSGTSTACATRRPTCRPRSSTTSSAPRTRPRASCSPRATCRRGGRPRACR